MNANILGKQPVKLQICSSVECIPFFFFFPQKEEGKKKVETDF